MTDSITVNYTPIIVIALNDREVGLVWVNDDGKLGILVKCATAPFLIKIEQTLEAEGVSRATDLILGAMSLMALCLPPSPANLKGCFDAANAMVFWETDKERIDVLAPLIGQRGAALVVEKGWPNALELIARAFTPADRAKVNNACTLYFTNPASNALQ